MRQLIVTGGYPYSTHTFVIREIAASIAAGNEVYVLASNRGDKAGATLAARLGMPDPAHLLYGDYANSRLFAPSLCRFGRRVRSAADVAVYGRRLAERRKTFFCHALSRLPRLDLIHANFAGWAFEVGMPLSQILDIPLTITVHNNHEQLRRRSLHSLQALQQRAAALALVSRSSQRIWAQRTGSEHRLRVIYNGIELSEFPDRQPDTADSAPRLISIGRLAREKSIDEGIRIFSRLKQKFHDCIYHIIGDGPERAELESLANRLGYRESIIFHGTLTHEQVRKQLANSDILLHTGVDESFGLVITEAMAAYKPVVASNSGAVPELITHGETGYLYEPGNEDRALNYLTSLAADAEMRNKLGRQGHKVVEERFSWPAHMERMEQLWLDALAMKP
ncbi:hypothetical protein Tel_13495 [Candidatus Tenderia electrophaga]|jgi:glycosyltransferase involved in cell wall biosynthesis|uniref:Glycosyl transferase family 1 n=1 Tax=Candidatus Tenderia electrophaga TaxID=1748243 RepID=A0A0S2TFZ1_9GAMM|nr:hypothetical protein Tel_13495 [Candidatus Tenderia electrophaga]